VEVSAAGWRDGGSAANDGVGAGAGRLEVSCEAGDGGGGDGGGGDGGVGDGGGGEGAGAIGSGAGRMEVGCRAGDGSEFAGAEGASGLEARCGGEVGGERHSSSCGICICLGQHSSPATRPGHLTYCFCLFTRRGCQLR
jgi:hypothetical protein